MATSPSRRTAPRIAVVDGQPTTTSRDIAETFSKRHDDVLKRIRALDCSPEYHARNFAEMVIEVEIGSGATRKDPAYRITRDGFAFLCMGFTGAKAASWKEKYINTFNRLEEKLAAQVAQPTPVIRQSSINPAQLLLTGQSEPVPLTAAQQDLVADHAWKLAGQARKLIEQHLLRRVAYFTPGIHAHGASLADVTKVVSSVTLGQALTHHHQTELRQVLKTLEIAKSFADTALDSVQKAISQNEGGAA